VAGVVSEKPGMILGEGSADKAQIATTGRVRVKVDASRGAIAVGDLLVTSDRPGAAMRSEPVSVAGIEMHRPGTLIGKALEPLASGQGEILVLLSLQ
jgi:nucleoside phosphorylase